MSTETRGRVRVEECAKRVRAYLAGVAVADSTRVRMVWEGPTYPTYYFPLDDVRTDLLTPPGETRRSPSRGDATVFDLRVGDRVAAAAAYRHADSPLEGLRELVAFTWSALDHWFDISAAKRDLGYAPQVSLDDGFARLAAALSA